MYASRRVETETRTLNVRRPKYPWVNPFVLLTLGISRHSVPSPKDEGAHHDRGLMSPVLVRSGGHLAVLGRVQHV